MKFKKFIIFNLIHLILKVLINLKDNKPLENINIKEEDSIESILNYNDNIYQHSVVEISNNINELYKRLEKDSDNIKLKPN